jgi:membrane protease YdiL (CAAX protease family)
VRSQQSRLPISLVVLAIWTVIVGLAARWTAGPQTSVVEFVSNGIAWPIVLAAAFLLLVVWVMGWSDIGFHRFKVLPTLRLMWLPMIYLAVFAGIAIALGLPPGRNLAFIVLNTCFVGLSEELMFRGILFNGLRSRLGLRSSIWICCILFGAIHVLNAFQTGMMEAAMLQAVAAFMTGTLFLALRMRTGSLYPVIVLHAVWDCLPLLIATHVAPPATGQPLPAMAYLAPLFVLPNLLYGAYLLRPKGLAKITAL